MPTEHAPVPSHRQPALRSRRALLGAAGAAALSGFTIRSGRAASATPIATPVSGDPVERVLRITRQVMADAGLNAALVRVVADGREVVTAALGESMTGVPAMPDMRFRNGAVAFAYMATLLLQYVDQGKVGLDDPLSRWLPTLPSSGRITLRMLASMTSGYYDYVQDPQLIAALYADPFRQWTPEELIAIGVGRPLMFDPGTNWGYSHTNWVIMGQVLEAVGDRPLAGLLQTAVFDPLGLTHTASGSTAAIPEPVLHAYSAERRSALRIPASVPFLEESTYWNPSWTTAAGAIQTTTVTDLTTTAIAIGTGSLLSPASHALQVSPKLRGFGKPVAGCPTCFTLTDRYTYALGLVLSGDWLLQNPLFYGYAAVMGYLPPRKLAIATAVTFTAAGFDDQGNYRGNAAETLFAAIANELAPDHPLPG